MFTTQARVRLCEDESPLFSAWNAAGVEKCPLLLLLWPLLESPGIAEKQRGLVLAIEVTRSHSLLTVFVKFFFFKRVWVKFYFSYKEVL